MGSNNKQFKLKFSLKIMQNPTKAKTLLGIHNQLFLRFASLILRFVVKNNVVSIATSNMKETISELEKAALKSKNIKWETI